MPNPEDVAGVVLTACCAIVQVAYHRSANVHDGRALGAGSPAYGNLTARLTLLDRPQDSRYLLARGWRHSSR